MEKITLRILGGIGNQMFQLATAYAIAKKKGWDLCIDTSRFKTHTFGSQQEMQDAFDAISVHIPHTKTVPKWHLYRQKKGIFKAFFRLYESYLKRREVIFMDDVNVHAYHQDIHAIQPNTVLKGYFQSYRYFHPVQDTLQKAFDLPIGHMAQRILQDIHRQSCPVAIHYRDYHDPDQGDIDIAHIFGVLDTEYYNTAIQHIKQQYPKATFNVFSNRPETARKIFADCNIIAYPPENSWDDMMLMTHCHHLIMGNSSYSWWAGYLNRHKNPTIITEKQWGNLLKDKCTDDIFLPDWVKI